MTREDLQTFSAELGPIVPRLWACPLAIEQARAFNARAGDVQAALLEPARDLAERGARLHELPACLAKAVAEVAFWRRVLHRVHGAAFEPEAPRPDYVLRWLTS